MLYKRHRYIAVSRHIVMELPGGYGGNRAEGEEVRESREVKETFFKRRFGGKEDEGGR
jgi:hypothetical protein